MVEWSKRQTFDYRTPGVSGSSPVEVYFFLFLNVILHFLLGLFRSNGYIYQNKAIDEKLIHAKICEKAPLIEIVYMQNMRHFGDEYLILHNAVQICMYMCYLTHKSASSFPAVAFREYMR